MPESRPALALLSGGRKVGVIPGAATTTTPAIAQANTGKGAGSIYVLWKRQALPDLSTSR